MFCGKLRPALMDSRLFARQAEQPGHLFGKNSLASHPAVKSGVVEPAAANGADAI